MNFTWFASAYDNDDVPYRISVLVQIIGSLILAAGVASAADPEHPDFAVLVIGYVVMRLATVSNWIRAGRSDPTHRTTAYRYAIGIVVVQIGWIARLWLPEEWQLASFVVLALLELAVPAVAERSGVTPYHPAHIAERYGLFTVIVLGESVTAVVIAIEAGIHENEHKAALLGLAGAGIVILFGMWWVYFDKSAAGMLSTLNSSLIWGYGHYLIFASIAAVGAGLNVGVAHELGEIHVSDTAAGFALTVPVPCSWSWCGSGTFDTDTLRLRLQLSLSWRFWCWRRRSPATRQWCRPFWWWRWFRSPSSLPEDPPCRAVRRSR